MLYILAGCFTEQPLTGALPFLPWATETNTSDLRAEKIHRLTWPASNALSRHSTYFKLNKTKMLNSQETELYLLAIKASN